MNSVHNSTSRPQPSSIAENLFSGPGMNPLSGLKLQLLDMRREPGYGAVSNVQNDQYRASSYIVDLRHTEIPGLGTVPISDCVRVVQEKSISPAIRDAAFEAIYAKFHTPLTEYLGHSTLKNHAYLISDAVQDSLIKVRAKIDKYKPGERQDSFTAWVLTVTKFCSIDMLRSVNNRRDTPFTDALASQSGKDLPEDYLVSFTGSSHLGTDPAMVLDIKENLRLIRGLSQAQRNALGARLLGFEIDEIALMLGKSEPSIYGLIHRARKNYKVALKEAPLES